MKEKYRVSQYWALCYNESLYKMVILNGLFAKQCTNLNIHTLYACCSFRSLFLWCDRRCVSVIIMQSATIPTTI